ncbi:hypothetical protein D1007_52535 [Hordeum vulgare]|nr:hypothetical protein D1007_52535 [Hordeum vulgare]
MVWYSSKARNMFSQVESAKLSAKAILKSQIDGSSFATMDVDVVAPNPLTALESQDAPILDDDPTFQNEPSLRDEAEMHDRVSTRVKLPQMPTSKPELEIVREDMAIMGNVQGTHPVHSTNLAKIIAMEE